MRKSLQRIPRLVPVEHRVCSSPASRSRKAAFKPPSCKDSCVMSPLPPEPGRGRARIAPTLGMSQPRDWRHMGFPWSRIPSGEGTLGPYRSLPSTREGFLPSSSARQTNISSPQRHFCSYYFFFPFWYQTRGGRSRGLPSSLPAPLCSQAGVVPTAPLRH